MSESEAEFEAEQEKEAAAEAGAIGGEVSSEPPGEYDEELDEAQRPLAEAGEGESEGFELSEAELIENASHGDEHAASRIIADADLLDDDGDPEQLLAAPDGEADEEQTPDA